MNYSNTKIYKIWSTEGDNIYIGATTKQYLSQRMTSHRAKYNQWKNKKANYTSSYKLFEEYGISNCFIELIEAKECKDKHEQAQLEGKYIRQFKCVNKLVAGRTPIENREDKKEKITMRSKEHYETNKEAINLNRREKYKLKKEALSANEPEPLL